MPRISRLVLAALTLGTFAAACDRPALLEPQAAPKRGLLGGILGPLLPGVALLSCPSDTTLSATAEIGPEGGTLSVGRFRIDFPEGAVDTTRTFVLTVPEGRYLEIEAHAEGFAHYTFATPVTVTLDATRCGLLPVGLQVWNIDSDTKEALAPMGGVLDLLAGTVRFRTPHFSGYSIGW